MTFETQRSYKKKGREQEQKPKVKYEALVRLPRDRALAVHQPAMERGARCEECPLFGLKAGPVMGDVVPDAAITIIGEAPGQNELDAKRPFVGRSGEILNGTLADGGVAREDCTVTNALLCRPPEELKAFEYRLRIMHETACARAREQKLPEPPEPLMPYEACHPRLKRDITESNSKTVMAVGGAALRAVSDHWNVPMGSSKKVKAGEIRISSLKKQLGSPLTMKDGTIVVASYHPAFAMRPGSRHYMHVIKKHMTRAAQISRRGKIDWVEPEYILNPDVETIERVLAEMQVSGQYVTIDIETDKGSRIDSETGVRTPTEEFDPFTCRIRCIGFGTTINGTETIIVVPIRRMNGQEWWSDLQDKKRVIQACMNVLNSNPLVGHNLSFDTSVLLRFKMLVRRDREYDDTLLLHHDTPDNDLPHDLGFVGSRYFEVPSWKGGADDKYYEQVTDYDLHLYNCLAKGTPVVMADGRTELIQNLVRRRSTEEVCSLTPDGKIEPRRITDWHHSRVQGQEWTRLRTERDRKGSRGLITTPDHQIFIEGRGKVEAKDVKVGDRVYLSEKKLSSEQRSALLGTLLGDSCMRVTDAYRHDLHHARRAAVEGGHVTSSGFTQFKLRMLGDLLRPRKGKEGGPKTIKGVQTQQGHFTPYITPSMFQIRDIIPLMYDLTGKKRLTRVVLEALGSVGLAWWFMDDGFRQNGQRRLGVNGNLLVGRDTVGLSTCGFPQEDVVMAVAWFRQRYGHARHDTSLNCVRLGVDASRRFATEIAPHMARSAYYKLPRDIQTPKTEPVPFKVSDEPITTAITYAAPYHPKRTSRTDCYEAETRFCITVEGNHNFFTPFGLVKNCRDVLTTMRLFPVLTDEIYRHGTVAQYELDRAMAPIARDMGELGLIIDERKRGELSLKMNAEAFSRLGKLKELVGDPKFNPSSTPQIRRFLFITKKHTPIINTKGKDWEDGEDPSTNTTALTKLVSSQACDQQTKDFINTLLEYRAYMKLKGTYIDKLRVHYPDWKKEYGLDVEMLPEVKGPSWRKFKMAERRAQLPEAIQLGWNSFTKQEKKHFIETTPEGLWEESVVIPARPALSRLHTTYKLHVIPSGRLSTSPAVQNWPKFGKANMHEMIVAPPGHVMVGADLDQVELRLYAAIAGDKILIEAFTKPGPDGKPFDPHSLNAASLFAKKFGKSIIETYLYIIGLPDSYGAVYFKGAVETAVKEALKTGKTVVSVELTPELVKDFNARIKANETPEQMVAGMGLPAAYVNAFLTGHKKGDKEKKKLRGYAKTFAYLETYGGEAEKLYGFMSTARDKGTGALMFPDLKESDVLEWHDQWHKNHPETKAWQLACQRVARLEGYTAVPIGSYRKRFFPGGPNKPGATFNHVIQGAAAEVANAALIKIARAIPYGCWSPFTGPCLQIHDMICVYVPDAYAERAKQIINEAMNTLVFGIKITASAGISDGLATQ